MTCWRCETHSFLGHINDIAIYFVQAHHITQIEHHTVHIFHVMYVEIRAFYFGTMGMLSVIFLRGGIPSSSLKDRQEALGVLLGVLTLFVLGRLVSYVVDGPASLAYSDVMWGAEAGGACAAAALLLYGTHEHMA